MSRPFPFVQPTRSVITTPTVLSVASSLILPLNLARVKFWIEYPVGSPGTLYVAFGVNADSTTHTFFLNPGDIFESFLAEFDGNVYGRLSVGAAIAIITEET